MRGNKITDCEEVGGIWIPTLVFVWLVSLTQLNYLNTFYSEIVV